MTATAIYSLRHGLYTLTVVGPTYRSTQHSTLRWTDGKMSFRPSNTNKWGWWTWTTTAYNFREKTFPGMPDDTGVSCVKMTEPIEMPFGLWSRVGPRNHILVWVQIAPCQGAIFRGNDMPMHARRHSAVNCAKMVEPIEMPFWLWTRVSQRKHVHTGGTWRIPMKHEPCVCCGDAAFCQITLTTC